MDEENEYVIRYLPSCGPAYEYLSKFEGQDLDAELLHCIVLGATLCQLFPSRSECLLRKHYSAEDLHQTLRLITGLTSRKGD